MNWRDRAECLGMNTDLFFPSTGERSSDALAVCRACPVTTPCLNDALSYGRNAQYGVRGGETPEQRLAKRVKRPGRQPGASHGTTTGYRRGCRCFDCADAQRRYRIRLRDRRLGVPVPDSAHGTHNGYRNYGCRCDECKAGARAYEARMRVKARRA